MYRYLESCISESFMSPLSPSLESSSNSKIDKPASARAMSAAIEDSSIDFGDFVKEPLPGKFLKLLGFLALSLGLEYTYHSVGSIEKLLFGNLAQNSLLSTLDTFSVSGIALFHLPTNILLIAFFNYYYTFLHLIQTVHGIFEDIAPSRHEQWSALVPLPYEVVNSAARKPEDSWQTCGSDRTWSKVVSKFSDANGNGNIESMLAVEIGLLEIATLKV